MAHYHPTTNNFSDILTHLQPAFKYIYFGIIKNLSFFFNKSRLDHD